MDDLPAERDAEPTIRPAGDRDDSVLWNQVKLRLLLAGVDPDEVDRIDAIHHDDATALDQPAVDQPVDNPPADPPAGDRAADDPTDAMLGDRDAIESLRSHVLWGADEPITINELAHRAGLDVEICRKARMLLGLPDPGNRAICRVQEVEAFSAFAAGMAIYGEEPTLHFTRVLGSALASVAEGSLSVFGRALTDISETSGPDLRGDVYTLMAFDAIESFQLVPAVLEVGAKLLFDQAVHRLTGDPGTARMYAVGFVDLTGSTTATEKLGVDAMAAALTRFEEWSAQLAVTNGGRVIKYIGDEVMYVTPNLRSAAEVARELLRRVDEDPVLRSARGGVAFGEVLSRDGDWFGTTVNLAARLVDKARPNTILLAGDGAGECEGAVHKGRKHLRDIAERTDVWRIG